MPPIVAAVTTALADFIAAGATYLGASAATAAVIGTIGATLVEAGALIGVESLMSPSRPRSSGMVAAPLKQTFAL